MSEPTIQCAICAILPQEAESLLANNTGNRKMREHRIANYVRLMSQGDWVITGDAICISPEGRLLNGQHRMAAVVSFGKPVPFLVLRNCPEENFHAMDQGVSRTTGDLFRSKNVANATLCAAISKSVHHWMLGARPGAIRGETVPSSIEIERTYHEYREEIDMAAVIGARLIKIYASARIGFVDVMIRIQHGAIATEFWDQVNPAYPKGLDKGHPARTLRDHLLNDRDNRYMLFSEFCGKAVRAFNAWIEGREIDLLRYSPGEPPVAVSKADGHARWKA